MNYKQLLPLSVGSFAIGMTEFTMMGILENIAKDLNVSIPSAGNLIAIYALGVVVGAPLLVQLSAKYAPKKVLIAFMLIFTIFNGLFAVSPSIFLIYLCRFMAGLPHGAFFGVGSVVAARLAPQGKEAQAISFVFTGMTFANLAGVPLGTYLCQQYDWRLTYGIIAALGLLTMLMTKLLLPNIQLNSNKQDADSHNALGFLKRWQSWMIIAIISIGTGGFFSWLSYISPMMTKVTLLPLEKMPIIMTLVGLGMCVGNILGGKMSDKFGPNKASIMSFTAMAISLILIFTLSKSVTAAYILSFTTGLISFTTGAPLQMLLIRNARKGEETFAASLGQSSFNIGNSIGAALGGIPIAMGLAYNTPVLIGCGLATLGSLIAFIFIKLTKIN